LHKEKGMAVKSVKGGRRVRLGVGGRENISELETLPWGNMLHISPR